MIAENDKEKLQTLARVTLKACVTSHQVPSKKSLGIALSASLQELRGAFVILYVVHEREKNLRGCIGTLLPVQPLYQAVMNNTVAAALHDSRFSPVTTEELSGITLEINILTLPKKILRTQKFNLVAMELFFVSEKRRLFFFRLCPFNLVGTCRKPFRN